MAKLSVEEESDQIGNSWKCEVCSIINTQEKNTCKSCFTNKPGFTNTNKNKNKNKKVQPPCITTGSSYSLRSNTNTNNNTNTNTTGTSVGTSGAYSGNEKTWCCGICRQKNEFSRKKCLGCGGSRRTK